MKAGNKKKRRRKKNNKPVNWILMLKKISGYFNITPHLNRYYRGETFSFKGMAEFTHTHIYTYLHLHTHTCFLLPFSFNE